ncbi:MAG: hypothetical protein N2Z70_02460 [Bdellovibrionaceae bacterium]|jgi:hypothetical protein|nr:hypothetical protein [Pseudobdellovibrionaceae bacterium]
MRKKSLWLLPLFLLSWSCQHRSIAAKASYDQEVQKWSREEKSYQGLTHATQSYMVLLTPELIRQQLALEAEIYGWSPERLAEEERKWLGRLKNETLAFLGFYYTGRREASLTRRNSSWQVVLEMQGKRVAGEVHRDRRSRSELKQLYPDLHPWYVPYVVNFPVAWEEVQKSGQVQLKLLGPVAAHAGEYSF